VQPTWDGDEQGRLPSDVDGVQQQRDLVVLHPGSRRELREGGQLLGDGRAMVGQNLRACVSHTWVTEQCWGGGFRRSEATRLPHLSLAGACT